MAKKTAPKLSKQSKRLDTKQRKSKFQLLLFKIYSQTIVNSVTGETITWLETSKDTGGKYLKFILKVDAKCSVIIEHIHPNQDERFDIKQGELKLQVRDKVYFLKPGDTMTVPKGTPHQWWNNSAFNPVIMDLTFTPAQNTELFFEQFFGLCNDGKNNPDGSFKFLQAMAVVKYFDVYLSKPPVAIQKFLSTALTPIARLFGFKTIYRRYSND